MRNKGFTLIEVLLALLVMNVMFLSLPILSKNVFESHEFISNYHLHQTMALLSQEKIHYINPYSTYPIYFNQDGNVNMAQSFKIKNLNIVIRLGTGHLRYEKG